VTRNKFILQGETMRTLPKAFAFALILALVMSAFGTIQPAQAAARNLTWAVSITYQNVGSADSSIQIDFYPEANATPITFYPLGATGKLKAGAGTSLFIGNVTGIGSNFQGSAVMSSEQPIVATVVQFHENAPGETVRMRLLSNGFTQNDGSNQFLIATALANTFSRTNVISIQNTEQSSVNATIQFYNTDGVAAGSKTYTIPAGAAQYVEMDKTADTGLSTTFFNGSAIVTAVLTGTTTPAKIVAAQTEYYTNADIASAFEGLPLSRTGKTLYMATGLCSFFGLDTFYAIQNSSLTTQTNITVEYFKADGTKVATDGPYTIKAGMKKSVNTCKPSSGTNMTGFTGAAKVTSTATNIAAIGRAQNSLVGPRSDTALVFTAFLGEAGGYSKLALPFVRYANDTNFLAASNLGGKQRAFIAIQNLSASAAKINVKYYDKDGNLVATHLLTIQPNAKGNSNASLAGALGKSGMNPGEFGYYTDGKFGGAVIIEAHPDNPTAKFIAVARVQHPQAGEDYNAVPVP
jgi:hypothetical protein